MLCSQNRRLVKPPSLLKDKTPTRVSRKHFSVIDAFDTSGQRVRIVDRCQSPAGVGQVTSSVLYNGYRAHPGGESKGLEVLGISTERGSWDGEEREAQRGDGKCCNCLKCISLWRRTLSYGGEQPASPAATRTPRFHRMSMLRLLGPRHAPWGGNS